MLREAFVDALTQGIIPQTMHASRAVGAVKTVAAVVLGAPPAWLFSFLAHSSDEAKLKWSSRERKDHHTAPSLWNVRSRTLRVGVDIGRLGPRRRWVGVKHRWHGLPQ